MYFTIRARACAWATGIALSAMFVWPANAQVAPPYAAMLQQTAEAPRLMESEAAVRRAEGLSQQARSHPNPIVSVETENVGGSAPYGGFDRAETTIQITQPFEFWGKRSARVAAGDAGVAASRAKNRDARVAYAYDLARAYVAAEVAERRIALAEDEVEEAESDLKAAQALVNAGKETRLRGLQAEAALNEANAGLELAKANRIAVFGRLSALAGAAAPFASLAESLLDVAAAAPTPMSSDPMSSTAYIAAEKERDAADKRLAAERKRVIPDVTANVGMRKFEYERSRALVGGLSIPLPLFDSNSGNVAASRADLEAAEARLAMARNDALAEGQAAIAELAAADARLAAANKAQGTVEETYRLARIAYEAGKSPLVELLAARHGLGLARGVTLDARNAQFEARARLARLSGRTITGEEIQ